MDSQKFVDLCLAAKEIGGSDMVMRLLLSNFLPSNINLSQDGSSGVSLMSMASSSGSTAIISYLKGTVKFYITKTLRKLEHFQKREFKLHQITSGGP